MSETNPVYTFRFFRPPEVWKDAWIECDGYGRVNYRQGLEFGAALMSNVLVSMGAPDGDVSFLEVGTKKPLKEYLESVHRLAAIDTTITQISYAVYKSLAAIDADETGKAWDKIENKNDILARNFVLGDGVRSQNALNGAGKAALAAYDATVEKTTPSVALTTGQREAFQLLQDTPEKWDSIHTKTRNVMIASGWVLMTGKVPSITPAGEAIYSVAVSGPAIDTERSAPSEAVINACIAVRDNQNAWGKIGPRMKGDLKARGFVLPESKDYGTITSAGLQAIADFKVES